LLLNHAEDTWVDIEPGHLFSLEDCSNLSELTLDMERLGSCAVRDSIFILSTLDPARSSRLGKIVLEATYVCLWFDEDSPGSVGDRDEEDGDEKVNWEGLDTVLSKLAKASISMRGKQLSFILVVSQWRDKELVPAIRKWLPELLPRFNKLGSLHVHCVRGNRCQAVDDRCLYHDKPDCLV